MTNREFLEWIYARLVKVHGENELVDYMHKLKSVAAEQDEIERLRRSLDDHLDSEAAETRRADRERDRARTAEAEIELLQMQLKMQPLPEYRDDPRLHEVIEGQRAEIERLRGIISAVLNIAEKWPGDPLRSIIEPVREALGE